ncbi:Apolipoprotein N-acyltransferase [Persephonella hydrogeniphila]|uniref:Apolipoprotein N-acyltransferase n=1 Tax=Persephonella hydrogeniphila TaxID=198703 RepID=A0A285NGB6_9AQUI|nr:apolipoprotein N-acyltransferase [Persephonella hydrogeniphila]SNZ08495.1 Apolipoprotein N-acyltransferase [Persephonella hydrogeniphila]
MKNFILAVLGGLLISLSFPDSFIPFVYIGGFFVIFYFIYRENSAKKSVFYILLTGFSFTVFSFYWMVFALSRYGDVNLIVAIILFVLFGIAFSALQFVPFGLFLFFIRKYKNSILLAPFIWVFLEIIREFIPFTGFPWNLMGYTLSYINPVAQITSIGSIYSLSFLSIFFSVAVFLFLTQRSLLSISLIISSIIIFTAVYLWGDSRIKNFKKEGTKKNIAIIQGNISQDIKNSQDRLKIIEKYLHLIKIASKNNVDLIILPESAIPVYPLYQEEDVYRDYFFDQLRDIKKPILSGFDNIYYKNDKLIIHNSIFLIDKKGNIIDFYNKIKLVPFGEYVPFPFGVFKFLFPYLEGYDFLPGEKKKVIMFKEFKIVPLICFESIFPTFVADFSQKGNILVNVTNDGWFGKTSAPFQHFEMARIRAIENGRYLIRAANTGISAVITPTGNIEYSLGMFEEGIILDTVYLNNEKTFWCKYHKLILISIIASFIIFVTFLIIPFHVGRFKNENYNQRSN